MLEEAEIAALDRPALSVDGFIIHFRGIETVRSQSHDQLDLLLLKDGKRIGVECKRKDAPRLTPSMKIAMEDLQLDSLIVLYPGEKAYPLAERIQVMPLIRLADTENISIR